MVFFHLQISSQGMGLLMHVRSIFFKDYFSFRSKTCKLIHSFYNDNNCLTFVLRKTKSFLILTVFLHIYLQL
ncbi:hypothetical protein CW304_27615 [Bacillus sp. UFRGS-B20]|nr:hypothetical protein CW304_27615 [Bacillus sp. UFRGS-B20]